MSQSEKDPRSMTRSMTPPDPHPADCLETPSGKGAGDENFPVGSFLIRANLRRHVHAFYQFARMADDVVDNPDLDGPEKIRRLSRMGDIVAGRVAADEAVLLSPACWRLRLSLNETGITPQHGLDLLTAFIQDSSKTRYADWDELIGYCLYSAAPVGRYLLDLHGVGPACRTASDALCNALQIINHLQDCGKDYLTLDRVYLPSNVMDAAGVRVQDLARPALSPGMRDVIDRLLPPTAALLDEAASLLRLVEDPWLALECHVIHTLASRLLMRLKQEDPLATRVVFTKYQAGLIAVSALVGGAARRFGAPVLPLSKDGKQAS